MSGTDITYKTTFDQLPQNFQEAFIKHQIKIQTEETIYEEISQHSYQSINEMNKKMKDAEKKLKGISETLTIDSKKVNEFNLLVRKQMREADQQLRTSTRIGTSSQFTTNSSRTFPSEYFWRLLGEFESKMQQYKQQIEDIESVLRTKTPSNSEPSVIGEIIQFNNETFISVASKVAETHHKLQNIKRDIIKVLGDDPFKRKDSTMDTDKKEEFLLPPVPLQALNTPSNNNTSNSSLFGSNSMQTSGGIFGNTPNTSSSNLFGNTSNTSSNLFGNTNNTSSLFTNTPLTSTTKKNFGKLRNSLS